MKEIKLVIWDLDDSFWNGTLSEEKVELNKDNVEILKILTDRGIMNTIVSKNDRTKALQELKRLIPLESGYFIFPSINWTPKGERVKGLLEQIGIKPENALMIDDNNHNLEEIKFYNPEINCITPNMLIDLMGLPQLQGKDDSLHTRLKQYKNIEKREENRRKYSSNDDFLRCAGIRIYFYNDFENHVDRIYELIHRTNQLNFTKQRISKEELLKILSDKETKSAYVRVVDKFGDYGICGFYALRKGKLIHFLFSCRILGMGIEQYVYASLGYPDVEIRGEVAVQLSNKTKPDWITALNRNDESTTKIINTPKTKILLVGGCDLDQTSIYLQCEELEIHKEFNTIYEGREYRSSDSCQLINALNLSNELKDRLCHNLPFYDDRITFATKMFDETYRIIVYSVVDDYIRGIYASKTDSNLFVGFAGYFDQKEWLGKYSQEELKWFTENFEYIGREPVDMFEKNLREIAEALNKKMLILINGSDIDVSDLIGKDRIQRNIEMNAIVDKIVAAYDNVYLLDMRKIVVCREDTINDNRHFKRHVYYAMSQELMKILNENLKKVVK